MHRVGDAKRPLGTRNSPLIHLRMRITSPSPTCVLPMPFIAAWSICIRAKQITVASCSGTVMAWLLRRPNAFILAESAGGFSQALDSQHTRVTWSRQCFSWVLASERWPVSFVDHGPWQRHGRRTLVPVRPHMAKLLQRSAYRLVSISVQKTGRV